MKKEISDRLKEAIEMRNLKQIDLAEKGNLDKGQLSSWISGKYKPRQNNIATLSEILDVNEAWLMGYDVPIEREDMYVFTDESAIMNSRISKDEQMKRLMSYYMSLNEVGKKKVMDTAEDMVKLYPKTEGE